MMSMIYFNYQILKGENKMKLEKLLKNGGYNTTASQLRKQLGWDGSEKINPNPIVCLSDADLTVWIWDDGEGWGILRDDSSGFSSIICYGPGKSYDDQQSLAAQFVDWDVKKLASKLGKEEMALITKIAKENRWLEA